MKIIAPVNVSGVYASVMFVNGIGETDNESLINWFKSHGYKVEEPKKKAVVDGVNFEKMTPNEIREWMKNNGLAKEMRNIRSKEKLIDIIDENWGC